MNLLALVGLTILAGLIGAGFAGVTITVFLHRGATHGALRMSGIVYQVGRLMTFVVVFMRHWEWRRIHRKHHMYTDVWVDEVRHDPHSPVIISEREGVDGYRRVSWHMAAIFHQEAQCPDIRDGTYDYETDRPLDALDHRVFDKPIAGAVLMGALYAAPLRHLCTGDPRCESQCCLGARCIRRWSVGARCAHLGRAALLVEPSTQDCHCKGRDFD